MSFFKTVKDKALGAWDKIDEFEKFVGRGKMIDDRIDEGLEQVIVKAPVVLTAAKAKVAKIRDKAPLCRPIKKIDPPPAKYVPPAKKIDVLTALSQDKELAAALQYIHKNPLVKVQVIVGKFFAGRRHMYSYNSLGQETQPYVTVFTIEGDVVAILLIRADVTHNGISVSSIC